MPTYSVNFETTASVTITVEAEDEDAAVDLAYDEIPSSVCAQCSGWGQKWSLDLGEFELYQPKPEDIAKGYSDPNPHLLDGDGES
mgnify:CR=1 FL=1